MLLLLLVASGNPVFPQKGSPAADSILKAFYDGPPPLFDSASIRKTSPPIEKEKQVFSDPEFERYQKQRGSAEGWLARFLQWLAEKLFDDGGAESVLAARRIIIWTIVIASTVIIIRLLMRSEVTGLIRPRSAAAAFNFSDVTDDLSTLDFTKKISEALSRGDHRLAIRWHYLQLLFLLDQKAYIAFSPYKTNIDYRRELKNTLSGKNTGATGLDQNFVQLSRVYEFVWYGQFEISQADYHVHASQFRNTQEQLHV